MSLLKSAKLNKVTTPAPLTPKGGTLSISEVLQVNNQDKEKKACISNDPVILKPIVKVLEFSGRPQRYDV
jgi:hypothetical protein